MEKLRPSTKAWALLIGSVALYDWRCPQGETMSEGVDAVLETTIGKALALSAIAITSLHLANLLPEQIDPFHQATQLKKFKEEHL